MNPDVHIKTEANHPPGDDAQHRAHHHQAQHPSGYTPNLDNPELRFNPVTFHNVSQLGKYFVLTNLFQGSNIYTIPKIPGIKGQDGQLIGPPDSSLLLSAPGGQQIPVNLGSNNALALPPSVIESNSLLNQSNSGGGGGGGGPSQNGEPHPLHLQLLDPNAIHNTKDDHMHPMQPVITYTEADAAQLLKQDIKPPIGHGDSRGSIPSSMSAAGGRDSETNSKLEMLKVNIEDISQFLNYHEVFGKLPGEMMPPPPSVTNSTPTTSSSNSNNQVLVPLENSENLTVGDNVCDLCGKIFQYRYQLIVHRRYHNERKPFTCQVCGQAFQNSAELSQHGKKHIGGAAGSMHICKVCFHVFANESSLERHMKRHSSDKPFCCTICQRTFARREHLENHSRTHTGDCPFRCRYCAKTFTRKEHMVNHERKHTGEELHHDDDTSN